MASARAEAISILPLGVGNFPSANCSTGSGKSSTVPLRLQCRKAARDARLAREAVEHRGIVLEELRLVEAHGAGQPAEDLLIGQSLAHGFDGLHLRGEGQVEIGRHDIVELQEARRRQDEIGEIGGVGLEQIGHDSQKILAPQRLMQALPDRDWRRRY